MIGKLTINDHVQWLCEITRGYYLVTPKEDRRVILTGVLLYLWETGYKLNGAHLMVPSRLPVQDINLLPPDHAFRPKLKM